MSKVDLQTNSRSRREKTSFNYHQYLGVNSTINHFKLYVRGKKMFWAPEKRSSSPQLLNPRSVAEISSQTIRKNASHFTLSNYRVTISYVFTHQATIQANHTRIRSHLFCPLMHVRIRVFMRTLESNIVL